MSPMPSGVPPERPGRAAWLLAAAGLLAACRCQEPEPTRVSDQAPLIEPPSRPERTGPFKNPALEGPGPREGAQLPPEEIAAAIEQGREEAAAGRPLVAAAALRRCANKIPPSIACEAELGIVLAEAGTHKATADHYLAAASEVDDPAVDDDTYRRLAAVAAKRARFASAASALGIVAKRGHATADDYAARADALQNDPTRLEEAIDALDRAYELDPTRHELLRSAGSSSPRRRTMPARSNRSSSTRRRWAPTRPTCPASSDGSRSCAPASTPPGDEADRAQRPPSTVATSSARAGRHSSTRW